MFHVSCLKSKLKLITLAFTYLIQDSILGKVGRFVIVIRRDRGHRSVKQFHGPSKRN